MRQSFAPALSSEQEHREPDHAGMGPSGKRRESLLAALHCPYCGSQLALSKTLGSGEYGILTCGCHEYPIVEGIPIIQQLDGLGQVTGFIGSGEPKRALLQALNVFRVKWAHRSRWHQLHYHMRCRRLISDPSVSFERAAHLVRRPKVFADYLVHRYANPSFLAAIGPLMVLRGEITKYRAAEPHGTAPKPYVLDLACGAGHASFLMQLFCPQALVVSADQDFVSLYLAKRFLAPGAIQICWDVEAPNPFPDDFFRAVFCLDAFHYFKAKSAVVSELKRTADGDALWLFPHLHNRLQHNLVAGIPLAPDRYLECFGFADGRLFDEGEILRQLSRNRAISFEQAPSASALSEARTLTFVRGGTDIWRTHGDLESALSTDRSLLTVNPIYQVTSDDTGLDLQLAWPNETIRAECSSVTAVLPTRYRLTHAALQSAREPGASSDQLGDLLSKFVLVPLPRNYRASDAAGRSSRRVN